MGDIDFEEQLELERLEHERKVKLEKDNKGERVDPDGTVYEWDTEKKAWFPKIDSDFIAKYQMNYGDDGAPEGDGKKSADEKYYNYYQNYNEAQLQHQEWMNKQRKESQAGEESHEETLQKLESLENRMQEQGDSSEQHHDSKEDMEKYTEEQKKEYNEYWSYYYSTDYHDYYADCLAQYASQESSQTAGKEDEKGSKEADDKKKGKKRKVNPQQQSNEGWFNVDDEHNTNVYVSGLPLDITPEQFKEMMTKYGLVMNDPRTRKPKLKLYLDENGQPKGDGRCCFIKKESVDLVLNLLDGSEYNGHTISVTRAQFSMKGDFDPSKKKKKLSNKEKRRLKERQAKLFDWRPDKPRGARMKHEKVVVLKNMFDPKTFEENPVQINVLSRDIRVECGKYGEVKKVVVYDRHPDGVATVHFKEPEEADMCIEYMHQRYFGQRRVLAATWDGNTKYEIEETEAEREARLKKWENFLESGETDNSSDKSKNSNKNSGISAVTSTSETDDKTVSITDDKVGNKIDDKAGNETNDESVNKADESSTAAEKTENDKTPEADEVKEQKDINPDDESSSETKTG